MTIQKETCKEYFDGFSKGYDEGWSECDKVWEMTLKGKAIIHIEDMRKPEVIYCTHNEKIFGRIESLVTMVIGLVVFISNIYYCHSFKLRVILEVLSIVIMICGLLLFKINEGREEIEDGRKETNV